MLIKTLFYLFLFQNDYRAFSIHMAIATPASLYKLWCVYKCAGTFRKLEGHGHFEVDSFHATPIGVMSKSENVAGRWPLPPPFPPAPALLCVDICLPTLQFKTIFLMFSEIVAADC